MHSTLIVARLKPGSEEDVARLFADFDSTEMPHRMGTRRRELFTFQDLYFHLQDFDSDEGGERIAEARTDPRFVAISEDLKAYISPYDPDTWRSPADAMARRFYHWASAAPAAPHRRHSTLHVDRTAEGAADTGETETRAARHYEQLDGSGAPHRTGTRGRELFTFHGLQLHLQDFDSGPGSADGAADGDARSAPLGPGAGRFYRWTAQ